MQRHRDRWTAGLSAGWLLLVLSLVGCVADSTPARVVGWNIEGVGAPNTSEFIAAVQVLEALDPDVVALSEIRSAADEENLHALADALDLEFVEHAEGAPFGALRTAVISRWPISAWTVHDAEALAGGPANDISRYVTVAEVAVPDARPLYVVPVHLKSGGSPNDRMRRAIEGRRLAQVVGEGDWVVVGDFNEEIADVPHDPRFFRQIPRPEDLPVAFQLGPDIIDRMAGGGLLNDPFAPLLDPSGPALTVLDARKQDGTRGTRPSSGRRLDYALVSDDLAFEAEAFLYTSDDIERFRDPEPAPFGASAAASDHVAVVIDLEVPPPCSFDRDCDDGAWCNGPERCDLGRCIPGPSPCDGACDEGRLRCL